MSGTGLASERETGRGKKTGVSSRERSENARISERPVLVPDGRRGLALRRRAVALANRETCITSST